MLYHNNSLVQVKSCASVSPNMILRIVPIRPDNLVSHGTLFHLHQISGARMTTGFLLMSFTETLSPRLPSLMEWLLVRLFQTSLFQKMMPPELKVKCLTAP